MPCNDPDHMEEPVLCRCGNWTELSHTRLPPGEERGETICDHCYCELLADGSYDATSMEEMGL